MQKNKIIYIAVVLVVVLVAFGLAKARLDTDGKKAVAPVSKTDASVAGKSKAEPESEPEASASSESAAITAAAKNNRYVFVTFYRKDDDASRKMQAALKPIRAKLSDRADFVSVDVDDPAQQELAAEYGADRSPIPLTLVVAPNGAVTAGYPSKIKKTDFSDAFVSDGMASVLKALQDQKFAAVCVQGAGTKNNRKSLATAEGLKTAPELGGAVEIVKIDPSDRSESKLMKMCQVDTDSTDAQLLLLAPPGKVVGKFGSSDTKDAIVASMQSTLGGGG